ncbi:CRISPR-associated endoribonuclease Cas6 [Tepidanaerobacter sp. EBM-38]|uniref:CRISPR-associated endoribonuclease Cas6 n=1 Tax=Tepidanaerobacter sp. EBM-38 TaxID=1918496 RepID=UPI000A5B6C8A|nr:CRISPR-associated endoribonuclease Cas6 [Tepidanaerobacter sp. EBM-38]
MRQQIYFWPENGRTLILPIHYNHIVQAVIYDSLDKDISNFLHEKGFSYEKRSFKMFAFSRLMGTYEIDKGKEKIIFQGPVSLVVTSPYRYFCTSLANGLLLKSTVRLGNTNMQVTNVSFAKDMIYQDKIQIRTLSPIVVYSTLMRPDGRKYTCYFEPGEKDFDEIMEKNLRKKYIAFHKTEPPEGNIKLEPLRQPKLSIIKYKNTIIKGYSGRFILSGPAPLLQIAVESGLGSKNSQGFGCVEVEGMN